jgi:hypothetical protein
MPILREISSLGNACATSILGMAGGPACRLLQVSRCLLLQSLTVGGDQQSTSWRVLQSKQILEAGDDAVAW